MTALNVVERLRGQADGGKSNVRKDATQGHIRSAGRYTAGACSLAVVAMKVVHPEQAWKTGGVLSSARQAGARMNIHKNARTTPRSQLLMVRRVLEQKQPATKVAGARFRRQ